MCVVESGSIMSDVMTDLDSLWLGPVTVYRTPLTDSIPPEGPRFGVSCPEAEGSPPIEHGERNW